MIKNIIIAYLLIHIALGVPNVKYGLELKWPSAVMLVLTSPYYSALWLINKEAAEKFFTPLYWYEDPHHVYTGRVLVHRQPDGSWQ